MVVGKVIAISYAVFTYVLLYSSSLAPGQNALNNVPFLEFEFHISYYRVWFECVFRINLAGVFNIYPFGSAPLRLSSF